MSSNINITKAANDVIIQPGATVGVLYKEGAKAPCIGASSLIRSGSIIYADVVSGTHLQTGHNALIREHTILGNHVVIGTNTVIDGQVDIGSFVKIESNCYIPTHTKIGSRVFIGPGVIMTNDKYPLKMRDQYKPQGPIIEDNVTIGGGVVILPGVTIGQGAFIAAGSIVTKDVPPNSLVQGAPGVHTALPLKLTEKNIALSWKKYIHEFVE